VRLLLDTHVLLWAIDDPAQLSLIATAALQDPANDLLLSAATVWEMAIKVGLGKLVLSQPYRDWINQAIADLGLSILPITVDYADAQIRLPNHHKDPFDRLIIAQALEEGTPVVSNDAIFGQYGVSRIW
jgi:PIN domain nuclease of toxin-antitoxin system